MHFRYAMWSYQNGADISVNSKLYYGLALIIYSKDGSREKGLEIVKETFDDFGELVAAQRLCGADL